MAKNESVVLHTETVTPSHALTPQMAFAFSAVTYILPLLQAETAIAEARLPAMTQQARQLSKAFCGAQVDRGFKYFTQSVTVDLCVSYGSRHCGS